jgi:pyruvate/oxaloacetate carboxyltransferase
MMTAKEILTTMLQQEESIPIKDVAGIITPEGIDSMVRKKIILDCLRIISKVEKSS